MNHDPMDENSPLSSWFNRLWVGRRPFPLRSLIVLTAALLAVLFSFLPFVKKIDMSWYDASSGSNQSSVSALPPASIVIEAGDLTAQEVGVWPWSHDHLAYFIRGLFKVGAGIVVVDDTLVRESASSNGALLDKALMQGGNVKMKIWSETQDTLEKVLMEEGQRVYLTATPKNKNQAAENVKEWEVPSPRLIVQARGLVQMETQKGDGGFSEYWFPSLRRQDGTVLVNAAVRILIDHFPDFFKKAEPFIQKEKMLVPWEKKTLESIPRFEYVDWVQKISDIKKPDDQLPRGLLPQGGIVWVGPAGHRDVTAPWYDQVSRARVGAMIFEQIRNGYVGAPASGWFSAGVFLLFFGSSLFLTRHRGIVFWGSLFGLAVLALALSWGSIHFYQLYWSPVAVLFLVGLSGIGLLVEELVRAESDKKLFFYLATRDGLTNLYGIRHFRLMMNQLVRAAFMKKEDLALILVDLDHFKTINDTYGHPAGDEVLRQSAQKILSVVRQKRPIEKIDFVARYGGEEFMVLVRRCSLEITWDIAQRVREAIGTHKITFDGHEIIVTASLGIALLAKDESVPDAMVHRADKALYLAKQSGRNRVCTEEDLPGLTG